MIKKLLFRIRLFLDRHIDEVEYKGWIRELNTSEVIPRDVSGIILDSDAIGKEPYIQPLIGKLFQRDPKFVNIELSEGQLKRLRIEAARPLPQEDFK